MVALVGMEKKEKACGTASASGEEAGFERPQRLAQQQQKQQQQQAVQQPQVQVQPHNNSLTTLQIFRLRLRLRGLWFCL